MKRFQSIQVIINPAAGEKEPVLAVLNDVFGRHGIHWEPAVTRKAGDAEALAREAAAGGADLVAGYGGDGTLMEVVNGLRDSGLTLGILPGGTGNGLARDLGTPLDLATAAELLCGENELRTIDLGMVDGRYFLLHTYCGLLPEYAAPKESKEKLGNLAYLGPILKVIKDPVVANYRLTIDGLTVEHPAAICVIVNSLGWGVDLPFKEPIAHDDGLLDLFLINRDGEALVKSLRKKKVTGDIFQHWQGKVITVESRPRQEIWIDGEPWEQTPFTAEIAPKALKVVVPAGD